MYIQTIGPSEKPKFIIYKKRPNRIRKTEMSGDDLLIMNPNPIIKVVIVAPIVPNCKICLRPYLVSRKELTIAVITC